MARPSDGPLIWIETVDGGPPAVRWISGRGGVARKQTCENEDQARAFVAGLEAGLSEARLILSDEAPRFRHSEIVRIETLKEIEQ